MKSPFIKPIRSMRGLRGEIRIGTRLTPRMMELWRMLAFGLDNKEIAAAWKRSVKTVEFHRAKLVLFFNFPDFAFLVRAAIAFGLVKL